MPDLDVDDPARFISGNEDIVEVLVSLTPAVSFAPGEQWEYSNTGYVLLATIIIRVSGIPFDEYLESHVFSKAGLTHTLVFDPINVSPIQDQAYGFRSTESGNVLNDVHFLNPVQGDGGIYSTLDDLFMWDQYLYNQKIVSPEQLQAAYSSGTLNNGEETGYGFGWGIEKNPKGEKVLAHSGGWVGFSTYFYRDISEGNTIIVLTNNTSRIGDVVGNLKKVMYEVEK
jgi:CubicO group peptidase (beta-lactamase class C family)